MKKQMQKGFTLIELMIVVAIIAILAAIAIPQYQNYVARSQATRAMAELGSVKTAVETCMMDGKTAANACELGWTKSSLFGALSTPAGNTQALPDGTNTSGADGVLVQIDATNNKAYIAGKLGNNASTAVAGKIIQWVRSEVGSWACETDLDKKYIPAGCEYKGS